MTTTETGAEARDCRPLIGIARDDACRQVVAGRVRALDGLVCVVDDVDRGDDPQSGNRPFPF